MRKISLLFITIERLRIKFTSNGKHEFVPHDQVSSLYLLFTVHYFYTLIRSFMQFFSDWNFIYSFSILRNSQLESDFCRLLYLYSFMISFQDTCKLQCWLLFTLFAGCIQWLPDITMFTQGPQRMCHCYDTKRHVSYQVIHFFEITKVPYKKPRN